MEELRHRNDIEIKLLSNRRFIYSNRRSNIVITAENRATEITVLFPDEYEDYSKRVDFVNSQGKEWTEGLYTPEYEKHGHGKKNHGENKCRFRFSLPTEVTTAGELKMQFLAYKPDESMTTVPFEIITIDVQEGVLAFKRNAKANPDLLILSYNRSTEALFHSEQAKAKSIQALENSENAVAVSEEAKTIAESAETKSDEAIAATVLNAENLASETAARIQADADLHGEIVAETEARQAAITAEAVAREQADSGLHGEILAEVTARETALDGEREARESADATERAERIEAVAGEATARESADNAEAQARIDGDAVNTATIETETARALAEESALNSALSAESERAIAAEQNFADNLAAEVMRATQSENGLAEAIAVEALARAAADTAEQTARQEAVTAEAAARIAGDGTNAAAVAAEVLARQDADTAEAAARVQGDQINAQAIALEAQNRAVSDENIQAQLTAEAQRATAVEGNLQASVNAEKMRAQNAETALQNNLTAEELRASTAEQANSQAVINERTRAQTAENNLQSSIVAENARAVTAENNLTSALVTETGRATVAESGLASALNSETVRAQTQESLLFSGIQNETARAQGVEAQLSDRLDTALNSAVSQANNYTDQAVEQVRIDGTVYKGTVLESELPTSNQTNGDLYWISDFDITKSEHAGSAIWNGATGAWDFSVDKYKHEDGDTIVPRTSDGALKVADTDETDLTADTTDFGATVNLGFKAVIKAIIRKIKGLFSRTAENETAIVTETGRAVTAESGLSADLSSEASRATTAEQNLADALTSETTRATAAEQTNAAAIQTEATARAQGDADNLTAIEAEAARAQTAESGKVDKVSGKGLSSEDYTVTEKAKLADVEDGAQVNVQSDWNESDSGADSYIKNKPAKAHAVATTEYSAASKSLYGHVKFYGNANGDSTELLSSPTYEHYYNSAFDCNDYTVAGRVYQNHNRSGAGASVNNPLGNILERFCLEVYTIPGDTSTIFQRYISITFAREFVRKYASGACLDRCGHL
jgi:hypothetical protein